MFGQSNYNYEQFTKTTLANDAAIKQIFAGGPRPGERAPDFEGRTLDGDTIRLKDFRGEKNVVLTFGSATCPMTAGSIAGINDLAERYEDEDVEFLFVYVREAHPGDKIPAHESLDGKIHAAEILRDEEKIEMPILVDDVRGTIHRKYGKTPNSCFLIDKSGRVAFRALWAQASVLEEAIKQLLEAQHDRGVEHAVVLGGEDKSIPISYAVLHSYRALHRGGRKAILDFEDALGFRGKVAVASSRIMGPVADNPGKAALAAALGVGVLAGGLYAGYALRRRRFASPAPYRNFAVEAEPEESPTGSDYGAVGI
jgi:peroxiredoxin